LLEAGAGFVGSFVEARSGWTRSVKNDAF